MKSLGKNSYIVVVEVVVKRALQKSNPTARCTTEAEENLAGHCSDLVSVVPGHLFTGCNVSTRGDQNVRQGMYWKLLLPSKI